ncbi:flocculation protein FLO11-like [Lactuca sativa]|uniref:flocculation protein FLO11-like n=1 Tax=Lactuca sativa TaxID=4236 RepID=UPI000CD936EA|nr:flocculation protein FLO11-like [Lactuca sativa]
MYECVSKANKLISEYKKLPDTGPRPLTPEMQQSLDMIDKPAKRGKKGDTRKKFQEGTSSKPVIPKKRKGSTTDPSAPKNRKLKKMAHKTKAPSSSDSDYFPSDQDVEVEQEPEQDKSNDSVREVSPEVIPTNTISSPPPSPHHTTIPISIAPCPPPTSAQIPSSIPLPPPLFTEATTTTTSIVPTPPVNASDVGAQTSVVEIPITSTPLSPINSEESDTILGGTDMDFYTFHYNPYTVQSDDDDDAPITKRHLKE